MKKKKHLAQLQKAYEQGILDEATYQAAVAALQAGKALQRRYEDRARLRNREAWQRARAVWRWVAICS